jgi:hypothetical protein
VKVVDLPEGLEPEDYGIVVDGRLPGPAVRPRAAWPKRPRAAVGIVRQSGCDVRSRVTLAWATLVVQNDDVHSLTLDADSDDVAEALRRGLDTRGIRERTTRLPIRPDAGFVGGAGAP